MSYGQGSLTQDRRNGKWLARYWGPDGKQRSKSFDRKTDARTFLASVQTDKARGTFIDPKGAQVRFSEWAEQWFRGRHGLGNAGRARDESLLRNHVLPEFGRAPLGRIGILDVRSWVNDLVAKGLSARTIAACFRLFSAIMRSAVAAKLIAEAPLAKDVIDLPKIERKPERFLTETELERLVEAFDPHYRPLVFTFAYSGCRWQELAGLKRCYLDLDAGRIHVRGVFERVGGTIRYKEHPKSEAARRTVSLPRLLLDILRADRDRQPLGEWAFTGKEGGIMRESNFRRPWRKAVAAAGLAPLTPHDLRHTHAAWLIRDGMQPLALQRRLGHKDIRTTMNVYGHLFPNFEEAAVETLNRRWEAARSDESAKIFSLPS